MVADVLLAAIHAAPDDDAPRLVYADALAESGDPPDIARAEFVRVQLALARLSAGHPRTGPLVARQADLLQQFHAAWTAPVKGLVAGVEFRRGLLDAVSVDTGQFLTIGAELFRRMAIRRSAPAGRDTSSRPARGFAAAEPYSRTRPGRDGTRQWRTARPLAVALPVGGGIARRQLQRPRRPRHGAARGIGHPAIAASPLGHGQPDRGGWCDSPREFTMVSPPSRLHRHRE